MTWLRDIEVPAEAFEGYQNAVAYRERTAQDDPGTPVTRIRPRALMAPPGCPDFMTRRRSVAAGVAPLTGRAWSGRAPLTAVSAGSDGRTWLPATLGPAVDRYAWRS